ncbi:Gfo/Idh/MocA family protein [Halobacteriovorax sp. HLS]|uniref:Gfo/Idh/MocA family protein n=1 Tax=Halobacteriovorax sp. HLS TaxID=2234000 RepID=UPI0013E2E15F|nr:Gfo/Idh/MocA family oxidoreductase [Halobacteriovorax sp. HLS]
MKQLNVAVIGYGHLGKWHADKVVALEQSHLRYIVDPFPGSRESAKQKHPDVEVVDSVDKILENVDAAIVVTPTSLHYEVVEKLLKSNIHVFCEKPMTSTIEHAKCIGDILKDRPGLIFQVGHSERCHQIWERKNEYEDYFRNSPTIRINRVAEFKGRATDVDVVQDLMIHDIDLLLYLLKEKPTSLRSTGYKIRTDKWDHVTTDFYFKSGVKASICVGRNHIKEMRDVEVINEKGTLFFDLFQNKLLVGAGAAQEKFVEEVPYEKRDHLLLEQNYFYNSILKSDPIFVDYQAGLDAVEIIDCVLRSLESKSEEEL